MPNFNDPFDQDYDPRLPDRGFIRRGSNAVLDVHQPRNTDFPSTIPEYSPDGHTDATIARLLLRYGDEGEIVSVEEVQQPVQPSGSDLYPMKQPQGYNGAEIYPAFAFMAPPDMSYDFKRGLAWGSIAGLLVGFFGHFFFMGKRR